MITELGTFAAYEPQERHAHRPHNTLYARAMDGADWYELADTLAVGPTYAQIKGGRVVAVTTDPATLWPIDSTLIVTDEVCTVDHVYEGGELRLRPYSPDGPGLPRMTIAAETATEAPAEVKEIIIGLAETISATRQEAQAARDGQEARIAALEATIAALKGAV